MPEPNDPSPAGAQRPDSDPRRLLGQVISGRYRIDELIGEGGMGAVYRAEHVHMRKRLAVKVLHPAMLGMSEIVERFEREAIAGAHIEHPNVAAATDFGKLEDGSHFLVLEFLEGEDLRSILGRGPLPAERALRIARQIALALRAAHQLGVVHRDLKPENVMLLQREREPDFVKVLDFGIAKVPVDAIGGGAGTGKVLTKLGMVYGTPEYMAPEQALGEEIDGRADLFALGVILYEMLSGVRPFEADGRSALLAQVMSKPVPPIGERTPGIVVPAALEAIAKRLLEKNASERFRDAAEAVEAMERVAAELGMTMAQRAASSPDRSGAHRPMLFSDRETQSGLRAFRSEAATIAARAVTAPKDEPAPNAPPRPRIEAERPAPLGPRLVVAGGLAIVAAVAVALSLRTPQAIEALDRAAAGSAAPSASAAQAQVEGSASAAPAPPTTASPQELDAARAKGLTGLGALAQQYPNDPAVLKALMLAHASDKGGYVSAVGVAKRLFQIDPRSVYDPDAKQVLFMAANGPIDAATAALDVMGTSMGSRGPDLLFELLTAPSVGKFPKDRAAALLASPDVQARATPALVIANDLRAVSGCKRKTLLARARDAGDARSLPYLQPLLATTGCGLFSRFDCFSCLGNRGAVREAIGAIEKRIEKH